MNRDSSRSGLPSISGNPLIAYHPVVSPNTRPEDLPPLLPPSSKIHRDAAGYKSALNWHQASSDGELLNYIRNVMSSWTDQLSFTVEASSTTWEMSLNQQTGAYVIRCPLRQLKAMDEEKLNGEILRQVSRYLYSGPCPKKIREHRFLTLLWESIETARSIAIDQRTNPLGHAYIKKNLEGMLSEQNYNSNYANCIKGIYFILFKQEERIRSLPQTVRTYLEGDITNVIRKLFHEQPIDDIDYDDIDSVKRSLKESNTIIIDKIAKGYGKLIAEDVAYRRLPQSFGDNHYSIDDLSDLPPIARDDFLNIYRLTGFRSSLPSSSHLTLPRFS